MKVYRFFNLVVDLFCNVIMLAKYQLTESRFVILMFLYQAPNQQLLPLQLAEKLGATRATVSKLLRGLVDQKRVSKQPSPTDKRATLIRLTAEGERTLLDSLPHNFNAVQTLFGELSPEMQKPDCKCVVLDVRNAPAQIKKD